MMRHVHIHCEQDFAPKQPAVGRIVHLADLLFGQVGDYLRAILEGTAQEFDDTFLVCG